MSIFWSIFISSITLLMIIASVVLLKKTSNIPPDEPFDGHVWDDDVEELNNPLPRWWLLLFYITLIFAVVYFLLYPGLGSFKGYFEWNQAKAYQAEVEEANTKQAALFAL